MTAFVTSSGFGIAVRGTSLSSRCPSSKNLMKFYPRKYMATTATMLDSRVDVNDDNEDDDATLGSSNYISDGPRLPPMTREESLYLQSARTDKEYMARMAEIADKYDSARERARMKGELQSADDYISSLSRRNDSSEEEEEGVDYGGPRIHPSDAYIENLSRGYREQRGIEEPPLPDNRRSSVSPPGPTPLQEKDSKNEENADEYEDDPDITFIQDRIEELRPQLEEAEVAPGTYDHLSLDEQAKLVDDLQKQIQIEMGLPTEPESEPESEAAPAEGGTTVEATPQELSDAAENPNVVNKQIEYLEQYLERLQQEAAEDPETDEAVDDELEVGGSSPSNLLSTVADELGKLPGQRRKADDIDEFSSPPTPSPSNVSKSNESKSSEPASRIQGLESTPGGMSAEEKMAIFRQLREQAMQAQPSSEFTDPFNVTLPDRKQMNDFDDEDVPSPESEAEYEAFEGEVKDKSLLIEEIEAEIKAYVRDAKTLLQKHETRLQVLLTRLQVL